MKLFPSICPILSAALCALGFLISPVSAQLPGTLTDGLVSYYTFDGNPNDIVGANNATNTGAVLTNGVTGSPDSAYYFGAPGSYLVAAYAPATNNSFTWSLWINPLSHRNVEYHPLSSATLGSLEISPSFRISPDGTLGFWSYDLALSEEDNALSNSIHTSVVIPTNVWSMLTVTSGTNNVRTLYFNGTAITNKESSGYGQALDNLFFGSERLLNPDQTLDGSLDNVTIYDRPLSSIEVTELYQTQLVPEPSTLLLVLSGFAVTWAVRRRLIGRGDSSGQDRPKQ